MKKTDRSYQIRIDRVDNGYTLNATGTPSYESKQTIHQDVESLFSELRAYLGEVRESFKALPSGEEIDI